MRRQHGRVRVVGRRLLRPFRAIRRLVRGALRGRPGAEPPASTPLPSPAHPRALDAAGLRAHGGTCLDVRPPESLSAGIVRDAWVIARDEAARLASALPRDVVVLAATDDDGVALAEALAAAGLPDARASVGGITTWVAAGREVREPAWKSPLPPGHAIVLPDRSARARGLLGDRTGWVQDVRWDATEFRFDVRVEVDGALPRVDGLAEEELRSRGPRGAAGLGTVL